MKTRKNAIVVLLFFVTFVVNAQLKVRPVGSYFTH